MFKKMIVEKLGLDIVICASTSYNMCCERLVLCVYLHISSFTK